MSDDPYTIAPGRVRAPPTTWGGRLRNLGPGIVVSGSIVGSGEILLTAGLGAAAGFTLLWWVLFSCWIKSLVQAEFARYVITSGDTYLRALNRLPGALPGPKGPIAWPIWLGVIGIVPAVLTSGGIIGGAGQALALIAEPVFPNFGGPWATAVAAAVVMLLLWTGAYGRIEKILLVMVGSFTVATVACALLMQTTEYRAGVDDVIAGLSFEFPLEHLALAIGMYGVTGVAAGEIAAYTYWCVEKGYPSFVGGDRREPGWVERAKGWIRVVQLDVWVTLAILTLATLAFYFLGAGVLHRLGLRPEGAQTVAVLANMYTATLGDWAFALFVFGAFCILFSTVLSGIAAGSRTFPDLLVTMGFIPRPNIALRRNWTRGYIIAMPVVSALIYSYYESPIYMIIFGATFGAFMLPVQAYAALRMQRKHMDPRVRPGRWLRAALLLVFLAMAGLCVAYLWLSVLPRLG